MTKLAPLVKPPTRYTAPGTVIGWADDFQAWKIIGTGPEGKEDGVVFYAVNSRIGEAPVEAQAAPVEAQAAYADGTVAVSQAAAEEHIVTVTRTEGLFGTTEVTTFEDRTAYSAAAAADTAPPAEDPNAGGYAGTSDPGNRWDLRGSICSFFLSSSPLSLPRRLFPALAPPLFSSRSVVVVFVRCRSCVGLAAPHRHGAESQYHRLSGVDRAQPPRRGRTVRG